MHKDTIFPWRDDNNISFFIDGKQFYPAMLEAIEQAEKFVLMEMYLFESGDIANKFIQAFVDAAQRQLKVQLLVDDYGSLNLSKFDRNRLLQAGVTLVFYNPLRLKQFKKNLFRTHRKYLIIDDKKAFVGGAGITDLFNGKKAWRETVVEIQGKVVADWHTLFINNYKHWSSEAVPKAQAYPYKHGIKARLAYTEGGVNLEIKKVLLNQMNNSGKIIWLASAYFIPSRKIRKALRRAAIKGTDVRLLLPGPVTDHPAVRYASRRYYARLLRFGVRIFEYQERFTHTKMVLVDDWFTIGSSNMDRWNFRWNLEANQETKDKKTAEIARKVMLNDFKNCHEIHYQQWMRRSRMLRFKEWIWGKADLWLSAYLK